MRKSGRVRLALVVAVAGAALAGGAGAAEAQSAGAQAQSAEQFEDCTIYDSHAHLISDDPVRYPRNPIPLQLTENSPFGPGTIGIPGGMHGPNPVNKKPTAEQLYQWMAEEGVCAIAAVQKGMIYRTDNRYIVDAANLFPDRMSAVIIVDPHDPETPDMIRDLAPKGAVGIRFFGVNIGDKVAWLSSPESLRVWELANELGLVVDIEAPPVDNAELIPLITQMADRYPDMSIALDHVFLPDVTAPHFGMGPEFEELAARDNIYVKFTSLNMDVIREKGVAPEEVLRHVVNMFGADKVMWGSDIGTSSGTYKEMVERGLTSTALLNEEERRKVLQDTGRKVFARHR